VIVEQERHRIAELLPIRHERMALSPLSYYRGAAAVMAADLAQTPTSGIRVQACGDAHLANFGLFATPERNLSFDVNDFDETLPAPFEWDVKRLAASLVLAGRGNGLSPPHCRVAARASVTAYRRYMRALAREGHLDTWYTQIDVQDLIDEVDASDAKAVDRDARRAEHSTSWSELRKLTSEVDGVRRIIDDPPLIEHSVLPGAERSMPEAFAQYLGSLEDDRRVLLERYRLCDWARKVVGVGSVGTDDSIVLLMGDRDDDPLFLQVKQAEHSVLEPYAGASTYTDQGQRVVSGQRLSQAASDIFLGWVQIGGRDYYVRQLRDRKGSIAFGAMGHRALRLYGEACGAALARGHARSGDPLAISAYLGKSKKFDHAVATFAVRYADQTERDHKAFARALRSGELRPSPAGRGSVA
jgi:uncharacterized protein (DUF2252 family)